MLLCRWEVKRTPHGRLYYINRYTNTTQWHVPSQSVLHTLKDDLPMSEGLHVLSFIVGCATV